MSDVRDIAKRVLRLDPLASGALVDLARVSDANGDSSRAESLMALAGDRALRDPVAQGWLMESALDRRKFSVALTHLDAFLRTHPYALPSGLPLLVALASHPGASGPLADLLATDPPWRAWFMQVVPPRVANRAALIRFYAELEARPHPPTEEELRPYLDRLVKDGLYEKAYEIWAKSLPPQRRTENDLLYNGQFAYDPDGSEFDWKIHSQLGADIEITGTPGSLDRALRIEFSGARVEFHNVSHLMLLPPGAYELSGEFEADSLQTVRGLWWRVYCAENPNGTLAHTALQTDSGSWGPFSVSFQVPTNSCRAQILRLELPARVSLETVIAGEVSYRRIDIRALH